MAFESELVVHVIKNRLLARYSFSLTEHIDEIKRVYPLNPAGFDFVCKDPRNLRQAIMNTHGFSYDDHSDFFLALASAATDGHGYREIGKPSLHFEISSYFCNIHLDLEGYMVLNPKGEPVIGPDAPQHVITDLVLPPIKHWLHLPDKLDIRVPNTTDGNSWGIRYGGNSRHLTVKADCDDWKCRSRHYFIGVGGSF
jgi:hypothetical protein